VARYALVQSDKVENIAEWSGNVAWTLEEGVTAFAATRRKSVTCTTVQAFLSRRRLHRRFLFRFLRSRCVAPFVPQG
jgi:hypothetical protein